MDRRRRRKRVETFSLTWILPGLGVAFGIAGACVRGPDIDVILSEKQAISSWHGGGRADGGVVARPRGPAHSPWKACFHIFTSTDSLSNW